jgi:hypothetical protein
MISAAEFRKLQTETLTQKKAAHDEAKTKREVEQKARFVVACGEYREVILDEVQAALKHVRAKGLRYNYIMLDHTYLTKDTKGFAYTTLLYGFWNKERKSFDDSIFKENEVRKPFDIAAEELATHGYKLENVSDPARSKRLYIKLSWAEEVQVAAKSEEVQVAAKSE